MDKASKNMIVVASYFYPKVGGLEAIAYTLANTFQQSNEYNVTVITSNYDGKGYRKDIMNGITIHRLPIWFTISNTPINPLWYWQIKKIIAAERPDIIHTHSPVPFMVDIAVKIAADQKIPIVATYHSGSMRKGNILIDPIIGIYESIFLRKLFERATAIVAISQNFAHKNFPQFADKTYFIPTGVDLKRFQKTEQPTDTEVVTFVGRIEKTSTWKGIEPLLQAMAIVLRHRPRARLELVGSGDALKHYRQRAIELGISDAVMMPGAQHGEDLVKAYQRANVVVLPSTSDSEAFSVALIEAMATGRPVIGTNIGGTPQVIDHEKDGLLVEPNNPEMLATAIEQILGDREFAQRLGDAGARKVKNFAWDIQIEKYRQLFKKCE